MGHSREAGLLFRAPALRNIPLNTGDPLTCNSPATSKRKHCQSGIFAGLVDPRWVEVTEIAVIASRRAAVGLYLMPVPPLTGLAGLNPFAANPGQ